MNVELLYAKVQDQIIWPKKFRFYTACRDFSFFNCQTPGYFSIAIHLQLGYNSNRRITGAGGEGNGAGLCGEAAGGRTGVF